MAEEFTAGDRVQTPLGKGIVREVRNNGRLLVEVHGRAVVMDAVSVAAAEPARRTRARRLPPAAAARARNDAAVSGPASHPAVEVDLHGLSVADALVRAEQALNEAMLMDRPEVRLIHGRSGGRIRAALHSRLREIPSIRAFRVDPRNDGVTIVAL